MTSIQILNEEGFFFYIDTFPLFFKIKLLNISHFSDIFQVHLHNNTEK